MWKAAFTGRSETGSSVGRSSSTTKKTTGSTTSRRSEDDKRKAEKSSRSSAYGDDSVYATAPSSRVGEPRGLTESAVRALDNDDEDWEDEDKDARSERRSVRSDGRKHRRRSEKERSRSGSRDRNGKRKSSSRKSHNLDEGDDRAIPEMGSFQQFPGQFSHGVMGTGGQQEPMMSGALPSAPNTQFGESRADSYGAAADYYLDEGQSVQQQPGYRAKSPNMLVNPDLDHLMMASATENPAQDTGHGSAADFYGGKMTEEPQSMSYSSTSGKPSKSGKASSLGTAAAATAGGAAALGAASAANSYYTAQSQTSSSYNQQQATSSSSGRPSFKPNRQTTDPTSSGPGGGVYYAAPPQQSQGSASYSGTPGKQTSSHSNSNAGLYAAGGAAAIGAAGLAAYEINQHHQQHRPSMQSNISPANVGMQSQYGRSPSFGPGGPQTPQQQMNGAAMGHQHYHEHKGPLTKLKDGIFNLISSEEDVIKMEMYTEYIGVCKYCFDPRTSPYDAPRNHHYHATRSRDSFEDLRKRRSMEKMRRRSREGLGASGSVRVDKDSRYYSDRKKSSTSKTDLVAAGLATAGVAAGANALFNSDSKNFDDTYSIKSGHRESSAVGRRSRSSSRDRRRRSSHGVVGRDGRESKEEYVVVRTKDGRTERRRVQRSRSRSGDRKSSMIGTAAGAAAGAALGASAISAAGKSRHSRDHSPNGAYVRKGSRRSSSSSSSQSRDGIFGGFFSPSTSQKKRRGSKSKRSRNKKQRGGFFSFGNDSAASSDSDLAFGASRTDLPLRRKSSMKNARRKNSDEHIAATVAGIGATAAALAAAQKGQKVTKRASGVHLGAKRDVQYATPSGRPGQPVPVDDEWEDELPSDVDDASSVGSALAFGDDDRKLSHRQSRESIGSQSSGAGGLGAWGWRWGGKDRAKKRRATSPRPSQPPRPSGSGIGSVVGGMAAGAVAGAALDSYGRPTPTRTESMASSGVPQQPLQYVDPRPISEAGSLPGSRHASMPGAFDSSSPLVRPGPGPIQQPKPVAPIQPAFTQRYADFDTERPRPKRTQSSPVQSSFAQDAALIGAAAVGTAAVIASQRRKSKDVRFGFTEEQERRHEAESRKEQQQRAEEERRRNDRERELKREAERHTREQDVLRAREEENRRRAEAELERQRTAQREAEGQAEKYRQLEREKNDREESFKREREMREQRDRELTAEIERRKRELEEQKQREIDDQKRREREQRTEERRQYERSQQEVAKSSTSSSVPWGAVAAGAAAAGVGAVAVSEYERNKDQKRKSRREARAEDRDRYSAREVTPSGVDPATDDDIYNREYFNSASRSRSPDHARHVEELARKAAGKVVSARAVLEDNEARYNDHQTQAEYFAPEEISHSATGSKIKAADPDADNAIRAYNAADVRAREQFDEEYAGLQSGKTKHAPYGVPKLGLVSPTPPPSAMKRASTPPASRGSRSQDVDSQTEERPRKSSRSRSISWGVDQTHVYDVPTPEPHDERDSYIQSRDIPTAAAATGVGAAAAVAAGVALNEAVKGTEKPSSRDTAQKYETREFTPSRSDPDDAKERSQQIPPIYQQPFYESVSDIGVKPFKVASPGTEGAPPVQGFVEGEVEERAPHVPGGFDDDYDIPSKPTASTASRDIPTSTPTAGTVEPSAESTSTKEMGESAWDPPLSKKEKKKREKAAKRGESFDSAPSFANVVDAATKAQEPVLEPQEEPDAFLTKKEKKKREKALKRGVSEDKTTPNEAAEEKSAPSTRDPEPEETTWEPPLSKKEKKKREKEAKKSGFADVAEAVMTTGGVATVASSMADSSSGPSSKWTPTVERDLRDIEPSIPPYTRTPPREPSGMPGGWDSDTKGTDESPADAVDPFQFQVHDDGWTSQSRATEPSTVSADSTSSTTMKREIAKFNEPVTSSPLKSEVASSDVPAEKSVWFTEPTPITNGHASEGDRDQTSTAAYPITTTRAEEATDGRQARADYAANDRTVSPDDLRSVTSDPTGDRGSKRRSKEERSSQYYAEPDEYDDARSVAASEPVDVYGSSRKSKRRSRHEDDDTASVTSSRSKRDRADSSSSKKAGFFGGLFGRKPMESVSKPDGAPLSRQSTKDSKDSKDGDADDGERKHRRRKHRSTSEYGDDDDTRSVTSESKSRRQRTRDDLDEYEDEKHDSSRYEDENGSRHHRRRTTDDGDYSSGQRHHHRRRTNEESNDQDQSFLGMRVEDTPPLPGNDEASLRSATDKQEQGYGGLVSADRDIHLVSRDHANAFDMISQETDHDPASETCEIQPDIHMVSRDHADAFNLIDQGKYAGRRTSWDDDVEYLPAFPESRPDSPTGLRELDLSQPSPSFSRPTSQRVPVRFPFGSQPPTPGQRAERSISFGASLPSSPASPMSTTKPRQGRPVSTEIRPLYLVERNRKTPEVEEALPSLPSSKPSSRASSMVGSDEYQSAAEDVGSPERRRNLQIDTSHHYGERPDEDYLGSEQTTPRAGEFPGDVLEKPPRPEPQFYTWEDFARDERLRRTSQADGLTIKDLPELPPSRAESRADSDESPSSAATQAAAVAVGGAAVLGYDALSRSDRERDEDEPMYDATREASIEPVSPPFETAFRDARKTAQWHSTREADQEHTRDIESFVDEERAMEEGTSTGPVETTVVQRSPKANELDRFFEAEEQMEEGGASAGAIHGDVMDIDQPRFVPSTGIDSTERVLSEDADASLSTTRERQLSDVTLPQTGTIAEILTQEPLEATSSSLPQAIQNKDVSMGETVDQFMASEEQMEAGGVTADDPGQHELPGDVKNLASEPAAESSFPRDDEVMAALPEQADETRDVEIPTSTLPPEDEIDARGTSAATKLTKKQSKKAKKKEKSVSKKKEEVPEPAVVQEEAVIDDDTFTEATTLPSESGVYMPKTRSVSTSSGGRVSAILSDMVRRSSRGSDNQDTGLKSEALTETSQNDATVQTSLETGDSSAARHLEANIASDDLEDQQTGAQLDDEFTTAETATAQEASENLILQPEQEESWETSTTVSRKQSKKNKKKQQRRQQLGLDEELEPEVQSDLRESPSLAESREVDAPVTTSTEAAKDPISDEIPVASEAITKMDERTAVEDTPAPAEIPLPLADDREFDVDEDDPASVEDEKMDLDLNDAPALSQPTRSVEPTTIFPDDTTPMQVDTEELTQPATTVKPDAHMDNLGEEPYQHSNEVATRDSEMVTEPASVASVASATQDEGTPLTETSRGQEAEPIQEPEEEEFTWASSKKKGKKGKKGKKSAVATPPVTEPQEVLPKPATNVLEGQSELEPEPLAVVSTADGAEEQSREAEDPESFWDAPATKKKKGKKGKRSSIIPSLAPITSTGLETQQEPEPISQDDRENLPLAPTDVLYTADTAIVSPESGGRDVSTALPSLAEDDFLADKTEIEQLAPRDVTMDDPNIESGEPVEAMLASRQDGATELPEPRTVAGDTSTRDIQEPTGKVLEPEMLTEPPNQISTETEIDQDKPEIPVADTTSNAPADERTAEVAADTGNAEDADPFWAPFPSKKKSKKGKKEKPAVVEAEPIIQTMEETPTAPTPEDVTDRSTTVPSAEIEGNAGVVPEDEPMEFWSAKPKGKKGKKAKKSMPSTIEPFEEERAIATETSSTPVELSDQLPEGLSSMPDEPAEPEPEDFWAAPVKGKKGKKAKKSKRKDTLDDFDEAQPAVNDHTDNMDVAAPIGTLDGTPKQILSEPLVTDDSVDRTVDDFPTEPAPDPMSVDDLPPLPESPSFGALETESMEVDEGHLGANADTHRDVPAGMDLARDEAEAPSTEHESSFAYPLSQDIAPSQVDEAINTPLPEDSFPDELQETVSQTARGATDNANDDFDFAAHVARGLEDSGFDPNLVANDPTFQRRASPPGTVPEADPEETFTPMKRKKGKKGKKTAETPVFDAYAPEERALESSQVQPSDDFNDMIEKTLAGTGFDTTLLQHATSSSNDVSSHELAGDNAEFTFSTSKRKKGKKSKKVQKETEIVPEDLPQPESADRVLGDIMDADQSHSTWSAVQEPDNEMDLSATARNDAPPLSSRNEDNGAALGPSETNRDALESLPAPSEANTDAATSSTREVRVEEPPAHVAMGGGGEMDVDEMDRAYKAFKKNKRDKKKKRWTASQPDTPAETPMEEYPDPTESVVVPPEMDTAGPEFVPAAEEFRAAPSSNIGDQFEDRPGVLSTEQSALDRQLTSSVSRESGDPNTGLGSLSAAAAAAATAVGIGSAMNQSADEGYERENEHSRTSDTRSLGLLPGDQIHTAQAPQPWSFAGLEDEGRPLPESPLLGNKLHEIARDSGYQEMSSPSVRDSVSSAKRAMPEIRTTDSRESLSSRRSAEPLHISTGSASDWDLKVPKSRDHEGTERDVETAHARTPSKDTPLESTTKNRASYLFQSTPETLKEVSATPTSSGKREALEYFPSTSSDMAFDHEISGESPSGQLYRDTFSPPPAGAMSPRGPLDTIPEEHHAHKRTVSQTDAKDQDNSKASRRSQTPQSIQSRERAMSPRSLPPMAIPTGGRSISDTQASARPTDQPSWTSRDDDRSASGFDRSFGHGHARQASSDQRSPSVMSNRSNRSAGQFRSPEELRSFSRTSNRSSTPTLRRTSLSGDLRAASRRGDAGSAVGARSSPKTIPFEPPPTPPSNDDDEVMDAGASRSVDMSDVYVSCDADATIYRGADCFPQQGYGDAQASHVSPTRPPNMRKRQSMHIMELESRLDQLVAENEALNSARGTRGLSGDDGDAMQEDFGSRDFQLREKDNEISQMRTMLQPMQDEISRLTEINNGLTEANRGMVDEGNNRYATLQQEHADRSRELDDMREEHGRLTSGMRAAIEAELATALADKNAEIQHLREELDVASEQIRSLQVQIQSTKARDFLTVRDEDYFDGACQKLCQHVQQWVLRFSKVSDDRVCRLSTDLKDDKVEARLDNAILDGSDVDKLLSDRIKRRDVFMSVVMTMVWEFIFTRYLFGMDREQRQKLKALEKILAEVGPPRAVAQWRATTLTLLARRPQFAEQKSTDTEAVAAEIFALLCTLLPPPSSTHSQLTSSLQKVISVAVDLSVEMRTQRAEYIMLPPLQPEYDTNGDLMRKVHFNASLMNERSGTFASNEALEDSRAVVKIVLFPLVVKKGDEGGEGEEEIVVCPAQVLVQSEGSRGKKIVRVQSGAMEIDDPRRSRQSLLSAQGSTAF